MKKRQRKKRDKKICKAIARVRSRMIQNQKERKEVGQILHEHIYKEWSAKNNLPDNTKKIDWIGNNTSPLDDINHTLNLFEEKDKISYSKEKIMQDKENFESFSNNLLASLTVKYNLPDQK